VGATQPTDSWRQAVMLPSRRRFTAVALGAAVVLGSCSDVTRVSGGQGSLRVSADVSGTSVARIVLEVSAPDIPTLLVFNLTIVNGVASGTITIPAGSNRTIAIRAFDGGGVQTHSGSVTVSVQPGADASVSIVLAPLTGDLPITVTLGNHSVTVAPDAERPIADRYAPNRSVDGHPPRRRGAADERNRQLGHP